VAEIREGRDDHDDHDPLIIAALLDRDLVGDERTAAEARIASCPACAALHADLLALSTATRAFPVPLRPRDYALSAADAARLTAPAPAGPGLKAARPAGVMADTWATAAHAAHDTLLVASLADHSLALGDRVPAEALVATCTACGDLFADLEAIRVATREMPVPVRPRDFTLTADDAVRLRPGGWRRLVAAFGTSRDMLSRPLAAGLTTLGLAGLLFATIPSILPSSAASTAPSADQAFGGPVIPAASAGALGPSGQGLSVAAPSASGGTGAGAPVPVAAGAAASPSTVPVSDAFGAVKGAGASATPGSEAATAGSAVTQGRASGPSVPGSAGDSSLELGSTGPSTLIVLSAVFLIAGLGLFLVRWTARRLGDG
jgi:anti-sigma factor RsiW